jgi:hypothetical protein
MAERSWPLIKDSERFVVWQTLNKLALKGDGAVKENDLGAAALSKPGASPRKAVLGSLT